MIAGGAEIFRGFLVEGIRGIRLEEKELQITHLSATWNVKSIAKSTNLHAHNNGVEVQNGLPVLS